MVLSKNGLLRFITFEPRLITFETRLITFGILAPSHQKNKETLDFHGFINKVTCFKIGGLITFEPRLITFEPRLITFGTLDLDHTKQGNLSFSIVLYII